MDEIKKLQKDLIYYLGLPIILTEDKDSGEIQVDASVYCMGRNLEKLLRNVYACVEMYELDWDNTYELNTTIAKIITKLLFGVDFGCDDVYRFIQGINKLAKLTYENEKVKTGIYVSDLELMQQFCKENNWKIIEGNEDDFQEVIDSNKPMRKLVDNREYAYFFNRELRYIGLISNEDLSCSIIDKMKSLQEKDLKKCIMEQIVDISEFWAKNIKDMMGVNNIKEVPSEIANQIMDTIVEMYQPYNITETEKNTEDILYIELADNSVKYYLSPYAYIEEIHGEWRLYEYLSLVLPLFGQIANVCFFGYREEHYSYVIDVIYKLISVIKEMSIKNKGGLIVVCSENSKIEEILASDENINFNKLFGENKTIEILEISNEKLINVISVDGATIINSQMELMDFGRILKNTSSSNNEYGARTNAARTASMYGLAIKISEDGDVTLYKDGKICNRYERF